MKTDRQRDIHLTASLPGHLRTAWLSRYGTRNVKPISILVKQEMMGWQWHQLDHMQTI